MNCNVLICQDSVATHWALTESPFVLGPKGVDGLPLTNPLISDNIAELCHNSRGDFLLHVLGAAVQVQVNGNRVGRWHVLQSGDLIDIGRDRFRFEAELLKDVILTNGRLGCEYCFETLDPNDADTSMREAVVVNSRPYHEACWRISPECNLPANPLKLKPPPPYTVDVQTPLAPSHTAVANTMYDTPWGISANTLQLDAAQREFQLINNDTTDLKLDRRVMPPWASVDYGGPIRTDAYKHVRPAKPTSVTIYPCFIQPPRHKYYLRIGKSQGIDIVSSGRRGVWAVMLVCLYLVYLSYVSSVWNLRAWYIDPTNFGHVNAVTILLPFGSLLLLFSAVFCLSPTKTTWQVYNLLDALEHLAIFPVKWVGMAKYGILGPLEENWLRSSNQIWKWLFGWILALYGGIAAALVVVILLLFLSVGIPIVTDVATITATIVPLVFLYGFGRRYGCDPLRRLWNWVVP